MNTKIITEVDSIDNKKIFPAGTYLLHVHSDNSVVIVFQKAEGMDGETVSVYIPSEMADNMHELLDPVTRAELWKEARDNFSPTFN